MSTHNIVESNEAFNRHTMTPGLGAMRQYPARRGQGGGWGWFLAGAAAVIALLALSAAGA